MLISGIVHLSSKTIYGFTSRNTPIYPFQPFDETIPSFIVGCSYEDRSCNIIALCKLTTAPYEKIRKGFIEQVIGKCGNYNVECNGLLWRYAPFRWKKSNTPTLIKHPSFEKHPLLDVPTVNIDPPGCRDIDDCVSIWKESNTTQFAITIADVHEWIACNSAIEDIASKIGQTFYDDGKVAIPMLPVELSEDLCSLIPGKKRLGLTLQFEWTGNMMKNLHLKQTTIINKKSYTYDNIKEATDFPINILKDVASWLASREVDDPHDWIEQIMLFYNREAAALLQSYGKGIWRGHAEPDQQKLTKFQTFGAGIDFLAQKSAEYTNHPCKHWGIGDKLYCHASSPIRRWADVVNQSILKSREPLAIDVKLLNNICSNEKRYERDMFFLYVLKHTDINELLNCISIDTNDIRTRVWVPVWRRIVTLYNVKIKEGETLKLQYFLDTNKLTWKKRVVFRAEDKDYQESLLRGRLDTEYYEDTQAFLDPILPSPK